MKRTNLEKSDARSLPSLIAFIVILIYSVTLVGLFFWGALSSFKSSLEFEFNLFGLPEKWKFDNYLLAFKELFVPVQSAGGTRKVLYLKWYFGLF